MVQTQLWLALLETIFLIGVGFTQSAHLRKSSRVMLAALSGNSVSHWGFTKVFILLRNWQLIHLPGAWTLLAIVIIYESIANNKAISKREISYIYLVAVINQTNNTRKRENQVSFTWFFPINRVDPYYFHGHSLFADFYTSIALLCPELLSWLA